jgi:hypothetical protein
VPKLRSRVGQGTGTLGAPSDAALINNSLNELSLGRSNGVLIRDTDGEVKVYDLPPTVL